MKTSAIKHFTLVELMVAMAVLVIMMSFLFQFVIGAQRVWSSSSGSAALFEQAELVFDFIGSDFQNIISKNALDENIPFYYKDTTTSATLGFVCDNAGSPDAVVYYFRKTEGTTPVYKLHRLVIDGNAVSSPEKRFGYLVSKETDYLANFGLSTDGTDGYPWSSDIPLAENVQSVTIRAMKPSSGAVSGYVEGNDFPYVVRVDLKMYDPNQIPDYEGRRGSTTTLTDSDVEKHCQTFTKIFFLK